MLLAPWRRAGGRRGSGPIGRACEKRTRRKSRLALDRGQIGTSRTLTALFASQVVNVSVLGVSPISGGEDMKEGQKESGTLHQASQIVSAYVRVNQVPANAVPDMIGQLVQVLEGLRAGPSAHAMNKPVVPIRKSVSDEYIVCLEDGKRLKMLKRYLKTHYNMTTEEYRRKWGLPPDYPMVAPAYARIRSAFAKKIGLGRIPTAPRKRR